MPAGQLLPRRHLQHPEHVLDALHSDPETDAPTTHAWSKPTKGSCHRCGLNVVWIYTERETVWPFEPEEYECAGLPPKVQWRLPRRRKITAIQRPAERPTDKVLVPHFYVCPYADDADSPALLRIQTHLRDEIDRLLDAPTDEDHA